MGNTTRTTFNLIFKVAVHIILLGFTALVAIILLSDLTDMQFTPSLLVIFLIFCLLIVLSFITGIWETTVSQLRLDMRLFNANFEEAQQQSAQNTLYSYTVSNIYFILCTVLVVGAWLLFPDQLSRAEPLAYILTVLSALSAYSTRVLKQRLDAQNTPDSA